jgi:hypothetical protein
MKRKYTQHKVQSFEKKWGLRCNEIAEMEETTPEAIRMRVKRFGSPWQRRGKPTMFEAKYGKTIGQLALDLNLHPQTLARRERLHGDVYYAPDVGRGLRHKIMNPDGYHWTVNPLCPKFRIESTYMDQYDENKKV